MEDVPAIEAKAHGDWPELALGDDSLSAYLHEISRVPLLTAEEELRLGRAIHQAQAAIEKLELEAPTPDKQSALWDRVSRGREATSRMVEANLRLVVSVAKRYGNASVPFLDLIQEGNLGLLQAVEKFDYRMEYRFSTYATHWIRQAITRTIGEHSRTIRLPAHVAETINVLRRTSRHLQQRLHRDPTLDEIALEVGFPSPRERERLTACLEGSAPLPLGLSRRWHTARERVRVALTNMLEPLSLETPMGGDDAYTLGEVMPSTQLEEPADEALTHLMREALAEMIKELSEREQTVLRYHYGLGDSRAMTLEQIGVVMGVTRERVRQIEQKALSKLRNDSVLEDWSLS